ncbi:MAG: Tn3 family transposase [Gammaproteobacteria bacterium]|nr:Tn3 family transposase [Gammaproteobacteria bacterium]MCD8543233.1 Tn3 family transposase [Gammaproteobacteria bacterium]
MTSIYKTAYPYFSHHKKKLTRELIANTYQLTPDEILDIKKRFSEDHSPLCYAVLLAVFKQFNYFPEFNTIPSEIIDYIKEQLDVSNDNILEIHPSTRSRYRKDIYQSLGITPWKTSKKTESGKADHPAKTFATHTAMRAAQLHNYPADIINIVIEELKKERYELPTFKQLDKLVKHARSVVNNHLFKTVYDSMMDKQMETLEELLKTKEDYQRSGYNALKALPKNPTITHFKELLAHHDWLESFGNLQQQLKPIIPIKLNQMAQQARSLDASNLHDFTKEKRYTLMLCLILHAQGQAKDALSLTFCRTLIGMHKDAKNKLEGLREHYRSRTQELLLIFSTILDDFGDGESQPLENITDKIKNNGGAQLLKEDCDYAVALNSNNHLIFLADFYKSKRETLLNLIETLDLRSSTQQTDLLSAIKYILDHREIKSDYLTDSIDLSFTTPQWKKLIIKTEEKNETYHHRNLELCVLSHIANELRSKDLYVLGANSYADYRDELLPWNECEKLLKDYCKKTNLPNTGTAFVKQLKKLLTEKSKAVDKAYPDIKELTIDKNGNPILHKRGPKRRSSSAVWLEKTIKLRLKERNLIDVLCSSHHYSGWAHEFGPLSGNDAKIKDFIERYVLTTFAYATGMGATQTAQHVRSGISAHMLSWINRRHVTPESLDKAREQLINLIAQFELPKTWGSGKSVAGDGTMEELREQNLISEFHFRYRRNGGVAYHHIADNYILLFSTFMPCGVWEAVEIMEGLLKNNSDVQPDIIHGDTQAQSTVVFALSHLLGFKLMPRIRNWKDLTLFRPTKNTKYKHIDTLFSDTIDWDIIEKHWQDMMQVVLSIHHGKMSSSKLLRKLGNYSRKNRLYQAFQELGYVIRTLFLLDYISDVELRETITAQTNKVEAYNGLSDWCSFGSDILVASNDDVEMEKAVKYNGILTNSVILQNVVDMTDIIAELLDEGNKITKEDMATLCPYLTAHLKRFGDIIMDFNGVPKNVDRSRSKVLW